MLSRIGLPGVFGLLVVAGGLGLVAWESPLIAGGLALMVFGFGIAVFSLIRRTLAGFGLGGGVGPGPGPGAGPGAGGQMPDMSEFGGDDDGEE